MRRPQRDKISKREKEATAFFKNHHFKDTKCAENITIHEKDGRNRFSLDVKYPNMDQKMTE